MPEEEGPHEHVCSRCLRRYECDDPEDAEFEMGVCADCRTNTQPHEEGREV